MTGFRLCWRLFLARRLSSNSAVLNKQKVVADGQVPCISTSDPVNDFLSCHPQFSDAPKLSRFFESLKTCGIEPDKASTIVSDCPELLNLSEARLQDSIQGWLQCQFGTEHLVELLSSYPSLLYISSEEISDKYIKLSQEFSQRAVFKALRNSPHIMNEKWNVILNKVEYLENNLGYKKHEIASSGALAHSYEKLKERFEFLLRAGLFKVPKLKRNKNDNLANPSISVILLTTDIVFATKVANLSLEEFNVFKEMLREEDDTNASDE